jgi:cytochrome c1
MNRAFLVMLFSPLAALSPPAVADDAGVPAEPYHVTDGRVDRGTYTGWQVFRENCAACHGEGAVGTGKAPALTENIRLLSPAEFRAKVLTRYFVTVPLSDAVSESGVAAREELAEAAERGGPHMPPWQTNPDVSAHIDELYAYLAARADGVIGPGVPEVVDN